MADAHQPGKKPKTEKDFLRTAVRTMNLQTVLALLMFVFLPYLILFHYLDGLVIDFNRIVTNHARDIYHEFLADPTKEQAALLARDYDVIVGFEGQEGFWWTDGDTTASITPEMQRPYYRGLWRYFDTEAGERVVICWPLSFFIPEIHIRVFLTWAGAPMLFFLFLFYISRSTLYPLRWMQTGINEITSGNLKYEAPVTGKDRKNTLAKKFNTMTGSIRELIHSKDQLIMDVSHELRSPITRIKVALELLEEDTGEEGRVKLNAVQKNVQELENIISTILESQRINLQDIETEISPCRLADIIEDCVELQRHVEPGIQCQLDETLVLDGDGSLLKLLIHNLLDNALKYATAGSEPVTVRLFRRDGAINLEVVDDGIGIGEEHLQRVFDPFYKVARERGFNNGYGLGLSLCKRIAELHGADITLTNRPQGGVVVSVVFRQPPTPTR